MYSSSIQRRVLKTLLLPDTFCYYLHQQFMWYKLYCINCCFLSIEL